MPPFAPEPHFLHGQAPRTAILFVNLGTPDAADAPSVRRYLAEFLSDPRVVEIPPLAWKPILHVIILRTRPRASARKYAKVWLPEGSPLAVWTRKQSEMLAGWLADHGHQVLVRHAMRYGNPSVASQLDALKAEGATRILILPAYPQYSGTTTASVADAVFDWGKRQRHLPELRFVHRYHDDSGYIAALAERVESHWREHGRGEKLVLSFHGVPARTLELGDPYHCECLKTARLLASELGLHAQDVLVTFQSRFGRAKWLEPYTQPTIEALARAGTKRIDVMCPGFTSDCLETLEEIDMEVREAFISNGGEAFHYIPALNDSQRWIAALAAIAQQHLAGWPTRLPADERELQASAARAHEKGAPR
ncbi:ferrochelatase [Xylophilus rhododendri]|uniref:Ferrochelatase n=1 Tax=Xylophilus rhododendri TaxID=2697032 RepID=A0A857IYW5_9BURK|nr:ferrochelatase [Xylophilus rhododendri]QHI96646.1 ferrochelatase [Xylophilus rhododendri]